MYGFRAFVSQEILSKEIQIAIWISIRYPLHTNTNYTCSVRLGWDQPDMPVRNIYGMVRPRGE
jgi:hypothetical protein